MRLLTNSRREEMTMMSGALDIQLSTDGEEYCQDEMRNQESVRVSPS